MRDLCYRLKHAGVSVDISTFSKACKTRQGENFCRIYIKLIERLKQQRPATAQMLIPIDSTVITLTSKLFGKQKYHQIKLLNVLNLTQWNSTECLIHFGQAHGAHLAQILNGIIPENGLGIMDKGFASWGFLDGLSATQTRFIVRIKNNMKTELEHECYWVAWFCDLECRTQFRLATNL